jgi:hypothetical protein
LSVAVKETIGGTSPPQESVTSAGAAGATGATVSFTVMVCDTDDVFPQASVNVHVRVTTYEPAHSPCVIESTPSTVISAPQLSVAVSEIIAGTSVAQTTVTFSGAAGATGATVSLTVIVCETVDAFEQASVNVHVRVIVYELAHCPGVTTSVTTPVNSPAQLSVAVRVAAAGTSPSQATVTDSGAAGATGTVVSCTVNVADVEAALPQASVAVKITVIAAEQSLLRLLKLLVQVTLEHASVAEAPPLLFNQFSSAFWLPFPSHSTTMFEASVLMTGGVTSSTLIVCVAVDALPQASVAVHVLVTEYEPAHWPFVVASSKVNVIALPQASVAVA